MREKSPIAKRTRMPHYVLMKARVSHGLLWTIGAVSIQLVATVLILRSATAGSVDFVIAVVGLPILAWWLVRVGRWSLTPLAARHAARIKAKVATGYNHQLARSITFRWYVVITDSLGRQFHQRVLYEPWFLTLGAKHHAVTVQRCPGLTPMFLIHVKDHGTLFPAGGAFGGPDPRFTTLHEFKSRGRPSRSRRSLATLGIAFGAALVLLALAGAKPIAFVLLTATVVTIWLWCAAAPPGSRWPGRGSAPLF